MADVSTQVETRLVESDEEMTRALEMVAREPTLENRLSVGVVGSYRLICYSSLSAARQVCVCVYVCWCVCVFQRELLRSFVSPGCVPSFTDFRLFAARQRRLRDALAEERTLKHAVEEAKTQLAAMLGTS